MNALRWLGIALVFLPVLIDPAPALAARPAREVVSESVAAPDRNAEVLVPVPDRTISPPDLRPVQAIPSSRGGGTFEVPFQGYLTDDLGTPIDGTANLDLSLYDAVTGGTSVWSESLPGTPVDGGIFSVSLGSVTPLDDSVLDGSPRWLSIRVNGNPELPRVPIARAPYAAHALHAQTADVATSLSGAIGGGEIADGSITSADIADGTVASVDIADGAVTAADIASGAIGSAELGANSVTTAKILDGTVSSADLGTNSVTNSKLANGAVSAPKLALNSVTSNALAANSVISGKIAAGAVGNGDLANNAVSAINISDEAGVAANVMGGSVALPPGPTTELVSDSINLPSLGNVVVQAWARFRVSHGPLAEDLKFGVSSNMTLTDFAEWEIPSGGASGTYTFTLFHERYFLAFAAGLQTFHALAIAQSPGVTAEMCRITAMYFPTDY